MTASSNLSVPPFYNYDPSSAAAVVFTVLFIISFLLHIYQCFSTRTWYMIPLLIGGFLEASGYLDRVSAHTEYPNFNIGPYIIETFFLLLAPAMFAISMFLELEQLMTAIGTRKCCHGGKSRLTYTLVAVNIVSFGLQVGGGAVLSSGFDSNKIRRIHVGSKIIIGGLFLQLFLFAGFITIASLFKRRAERRAESHFEIRWQRHFWALIFASVLIVVRSIFRVIGYFEGFSGYLLDHEAFLYVFDSLLMVGVMYLFNVFHPSEITAALKGGKRIKMLIFLEKIDRQPSDQV